MYTNIPIYQSAIKICYIDQWSLQEIRMPKELMTMVLERENLQQKWGLTIQGGADLALTAKIASVKVNL